MENKLCVINEHAALCEPDLYAEIRFLRRRPRTERKNKPGIYEKRLDLRFHLQNGKTGHPNTYYASSERLQWLQVRIQDPNENKLVKDRCAVYLCCRGPWCQSFGKFKSVDGNLKIIGCECRR